MTIPNPKWIAVGKQVILKEDFIFLEDAILTQAQVRLQPSLLWVDADNIRIVASTDCPASMQFTGMPNILNPVTQVSGGLSDGVIRTITTNLTLNFTGSLYGLRTSSNWYLVYALAGDLDTDFTLSAMPLMRVKSQLGTVIYLGTNIDPATGIGYGFVTDELIGGKIYMVSGDSAGLMQTIDGNNDDAGTGGQIGYSGAALTVAEGDWFVVFPPATNFRLVGTVYNNAASDLQKFVKTTNRVMWLETVRTIAGANETEEVNSVCPFATRMGFLGSAAFNVGHPDFTTAPLWTQDAGTFAWIPVKAPCKIYVERPGGAAQEYCKGYEYPANCGF